MTQAHSLQIGPCPDWDRQPLDADCRVRRSFAALDKTALLSSVGAQVWGIATRGELGASAEIIAACAALEVICVSGVSGVGGDAVDLASCRARGIRVINSPEVLTGDAADLAIAMMLALSRGLVGAEVIGALGSEGMLVNVSRASNIDEESLLVALEIGRLGAAASDVFEGEPRLNPCFLAPQEVLLQPHHASGTIETRKSMGQFVHDNLAAHFAGAPLLTAVI